MFERGKLVLVPFPFTDISTQKIRPAIIISHEKLSTDTIVVIFISSVIPEKILATDIILDPTEKNLAVTGLKRVSVVRCHKIATLDKKIILGEIGNLPATHMKKIKLALRKIFVI